MQITAKEPASSFTAGDKTSIEEQAKLAGQSGFSHTFQ